MRFGQSRGGLGVGRSNLQGLDRAASQAVDATPVADGVVGQGDPRPGGVRRRGLLVGLLVMGVGLLCAVLYGSTASTTQAYADGHIVRGTVFAVDRHLTTRHARTYLTCTAEVGFTFGRAATVASTYGTLEQCNMKGQQVDVSVRGSDPATARVVLPSAPTGLMIGQYFAWAWTALGAWIFLATLLRRGRPVPDRPSSTSR
ncbi:hypothetical protein GCM10009858_37810 [Terrabacter carboxydivorans]|uniref:DUF3592 domain-containing protein n=1 Tax=Terrabacter carboxydivorans TaxID=619730 RepID=A0ABP5ZJ27_9MICO